MKRRTFMQRAVAGLAGMLSLGGGTVKAIPKVVNPVHRQFMHFPLRYSGFLRASDVKACGITSTKINTHELHVKLHTEQLVKFMNDYPDPSSQMDTILSTVDAHRNFHVGQ